MLVATFFITFLFLFITRVDFDSYVWGGGIATPPGFLGGCLEGKLVDNFSGTFLIINIT